MFFSWAELMTLTHLAVLQINDCNSPWCSCAEPVRWHLPSAPHLCPEHQWSWRCRRNQECWTAQADGEEQHLFIRCRTASFSSVTSHAINLVSGMVFMEWEFILPGLTPIDLFRGNPKISLQIQEEHTKKYIHYFYRFHCIYNSCTITSTDNSVECRLTNV